MTFYEDLSTGISIKNVYRRKHICKSNHILYVNEEDKVVFTPTPIISFRSAKKLSNYLVKAKN